MPTKAVDPKRVRNAPKADMRRVRAVMNIAEKTLAYRGYEEHMGRVLTEKVAARIIAYVLEGNYPRVACQAAGIHYRSYQYWQARAQEWGDVPVDEIPDTERAFVDLFHTMAIAEAQAEVGLLRQVAAGKFGWQAAMTILERRHPERWRRRDTVQHEGGDPSKPIKTVQVPDDKERAKEVSQILTTAEAVKT